MTHVSLCQQLDQRDPPVDEAVFSYLPSIFRDIDKGIGYSNTALQFALLAINASPRVGEKGPSEKRTRCLNFYTLALKAMAENLSSPPHITQVVVVLAILTIFLRLETKLGTLSGGLAHCKQADLLIIKHINQLILYPIGCRLLGVLVSIKSWYALQSSPWDYRAHPLPEAARTPLLRVLRASPDQGHLVLTLLCESKNIYTRILLGRLFGSSASYPSFRTWSRQYEEIRGILLPEGAYTETRQKTTTWHSWRIYRMSWMPGMIGSVRLTLQYMAKLRGQASRYRLDRRFCATSRCDSGPTAQL